MKVTNMVSNNGNKVANQFRVYDDNGNTYFQSYDSIIVMYDTEGNTQLDKTYWNYSRTTAKYRNQFLGETTNETQQKIDDGTYILTDLN